MDYHDSSAGTARLAVVKYAAIPSKKLGSLFVNPGDPIDPSFTISSLIHILRRWAWRFRNRGRCRIRPEG